MATSRIQVTEGSGKNIATYSFSEDAVTKEAHRTAIVNSSGTELGTSGAPLQVSVANTGANATAIKVDGSAVTQPISVASLPLPTGAATSAKQDSEIALLGTIDADTGNISTKIDTIAGAVSGTEVQVDVLTMPAITGTITCNAGTNLNTSALATEATLSTLNGKVTACNTGAVTISAALPAGANAIGKLAANSGVDIGDVDVTSLPALASGTNLIGRVSGSDETSTIYNGTAALTPKFAVIAASSSGDNTLVAAVTSKKIRVLNYTLVSNGTVNAKFQSATAGDISGLLYLVANTGASPAHAKTGLFETASGEALELNLSGAVAVGGHLSYVEV